MSHTHQDALKILFYVLIEIRATENLKKANILASVVHNVPTMIARGHSEADIIDEIMMQATRLETRSYFEKLLVSARKH